MCTSAPERVNTMPDRVHRHHEADVAPTSHLKLPVTNLIRVDVHRLAETLELYESDRVGFFDQIPRFR